MKALSLAAVMTVICSTASLGQFSPECNQMREVYKQLNDSYNKNPLNKEELDILTTCGGLAGLSSLNNTSRFNRDAAGCFVSGCLIGKTTSNCAKKSTILQDVLNLSDLMKSSFCPIPTLGQN